MEQALGERSEIRDGPLQGSVGDPPDEPDINGFKSESQEPSIGLGRRRRGRRGMLESMGPPKPIGARGRRCSGSEAAPKRRPSGAREAHKRRWPVGPGFCLGRLLTSSGCDVGFAADRPEACNAGGSPRLAPQNIAEHRQEHMPVWISHGPEMCSTNGPVALSPGKLGH